MMCSIWLSLLNGVIAGIISGIITAYLVSYLNRRSLRKHKGVIISSWLQFLKEDLMSFAVKLSSMAQEYQSLTQLKNKIINSTLTIVSSGVLSTDEERCLKNLISSYFFTSSILDGGYPSWTQQRQSEIEDAKRLISNCTDEIQNTINSLRKK